MEETQNRGAGQILIAVLNIKLENILNGLKEQTKQRDKKFGELIQDLENLLLAYKSLDASLKAVDPIFEGLSESEIQKALGFSEDDEIS